MLGLDYLVRMKLKTSFLFVTLLCLGSCSYVYDVRAEMIDGQLTFTSDKDWLRERCVRDIEVVARNREDAVSARKGDDAARVGYGTYWAVRLDYHCENRFPVVYGSQLKGDPMPGEVSGVEVSPKPLKKDIIYDVSTVSGATGYGSGSFILHSGGTVENLPDY